jgi:hypothetical protein
MQNSSLLDIVMLINEHLMDVRTHTSFVESTPAPR